MRELFSPYSGPTQLIFAFEAVVIGGIGSLSGTLIGGIILGVAQTFGAQINPQGFLITGHVVFLVVLAARLAARSRAGARRLTRIVRASVMSKIPGFVVERWTRLSAASSTAAAAILIVLAFGPVLVFREYRR